MSGPARGHLDSLILAGEGGLRAVQEEYRAGVGELVVGSRGAASCTVGTATDIAIRFLIDPEPDMNLAARGAAAYGEDAFEAFADLATEAGARFEWFGIGSTTSAVATPLAVPDRDPAGHARLCWVLALFVEVFRAGRLPGTSLTDYLASGKPSADGLLGLASDQAVHEVTELVALARDRLLAPLAAAPPPWYVGPTFVGSRLMPADADLIAGDCLVEIKTRLGAKRSDGSRRVGLLAEIVRQLLGYVLHDSTTATRSTGSASTRRVTVA